MLQDFLEKTLKRRFVKCVEWPPSSPDVNPLDYFFWDLLKTKIYQGTAGEPFSSEEELKTKIKAVWKNCATDLKPLRKAIKQFVPRLRILLQNDIWLIEKFIMALLSCGDPFFLAQSSNEKKKKRTSKIEN